MEQLILTVALILATTYYLIDMSIYLAENKLINPEQDLIENIYRNIKDTTIFMKTAIMTVFSLAMIPLLMKSGFLYFIAIVITTAIASAVGYSCFEKTRKKLKNKL